ncbi:putative N-acetyltransferase YjaB [Gimesia panareensis]|uniref:Putative N-acetyltransferase YjaB n=1 Tax=Gimesia panareensis TaxID=2527978 RepID=A0A518FT47_9PLAN|nr:GNAT family N-acetyltransferase [Gimesia panareensis]QDV19465.1 putative N-acetyltransferase YjaB [Gimesia panareensis]
MSSLNQISVVTAADHDRVLLVWEAAVRATHDFLLPDEIAALKPLVRQSCFQGMPLFCLRNAEGQVVAFSGIETPKLEALFVHPDWCGQGLGRGLVEHAIGDQGVCLVDVNEQNEQALGFYLHLGFEVAHRSDVDGFGKPYPLLHLKLPDQ